MKVLSYFKILAFALMTCSCSAQIGEISNSEIIEILFQDDRIENYLHFEINGRKKIWIVKNEVFSLDTNSLQFEDVFVFSVPKMSLNTKNYIEFKKLYKDNHKITFTFYYAIENIEVKGLLINKGEGWILEDVTVLEL